MDAAGPSRPPLDRHRLAELAGRYDVRVEVVGAVGSTNAVVAERARAGEPPGLVLVTEHQTAGRGRLDRVWVTPPRSALTASVLLRPGVAAERWPWLPLLAGLAVADAVRGAGATPALKWPNDVLIGDLKVAGVLVERVESADGPVAVVGVGINVAMSEDELPVPEATSLALVGADTDRTALLVAVVAGLLPARRRLEDVDLLRDDYRAACSTIGRRVRVDVPAGGSVEGEAVDVDLSGRLVVATGADRIAVGAGDVVHVRVS